MFKRKRNKNNNISHQYRKKGGGNFFGRFLYWLCLGFFLGAITYILFFSPWTKISEISISGNESLEVTPIQEVVRLELEGKYFNWLEKNSYLLIREKSIEKKILENFKNIKEISVDKYFPDKLKISLKERMEVLILCNEDECFLVDEEGSILSDIKMENFEEFGDNLLILHSEKNKEIKKGDMVLKKEFFQYLFDIKKKLVDRLEIEIDRNIITPRLISGDLRVKSLEGWSIYFDSSIPVEKEIKMLSALLVEKKEELNLENLEYIDLRSDKKIYYKFKKLAEEETKKEEIKD